LSGGAEALSGADAIVVAAGSSSRMGGADKLDHLVAGQPILAHAIAAVAALPAVERIMLVTSPDRVDGLRAATWLPPQVTVVAGGPRRHESVAAGLVALMALDADADAAAGDRVVLIHDGARPLASAALGAAVLAAAVEHGAAIPVLPVVETVKRVVDGQVTGTIDRSELAVAQTPQGVRRALLAEAFRRFPPGGPETWTDEGALLEACRIAVHAIPGEPGNLKVTVPADLARVSSALEGERGGMAAASVRTGLGGDSHPFGPGGPLALGGIEISGAPRLSGHSDGDVALHAVAGALLGGAGLGDLGRLFPAGPTTPRGIASTDLLAEVIKRVGAAGFRVSAIDVTIVAARPRLGGHLSAMGERIGALVGLSPDQVNVKASTGNLAGMEGAGRGISAQAIATLEPGQ
jgi:2-C-methyl-D-erythritol 4-phosphate cytidylyltransferase/2-C-methyl-D-erythritol 2,4-cyclodiphosphate synthase